MHSRPTTTITALLLALTVSACSSGSSNAGGAGASTDVGTADIAGDTAASAGDTAASAGDAAGAADAAGDAAAAADGAGSGAGSDAGGGAGIPLDQIEAAIATAMCDLLERCNGWRMGTTFSTTQACKGFLSQKPGGPQKEIAAVKAGAMVYDAAQAAKCVQIYKTLACSEKDESVLSPCIAVFKGNLAVGASCTFDGTCVSGWCKDLNQSRQGCPGKCAAAKNAQEACQGDKECAGDLRCIAGKCGTPTPAKEGEPCVDGPCAPGLACTVAAGSSDPTCQKLPTGGQPCLNPSLCAAGLVCVEGVCGPPVKAGEACAATEPGKTPQCEAGLTCALVFQPGKPPAGTCMTPKLPGEACTALFECKGMDQYCNGGKCAFLPGVGEACAEKSASPIFSCNVGLQCDSGSGKCVDKGSGALPKAGEDCLNNECAAGVVCVSGKCEAASAGICGG